MQTLHSRSQGVGLAPKTVPMDPITLSDDDRGVQSPPQQGI